MSTFRSRDAVAPAWTSEKFYSFKAKDLLSEGENKAARVANAKRLYLFIFNNNLLI